MLLVNSSIVQTSETTNFCLMNLRRDCMNWTTAEPLARYQVVMLLAAEIVPRV